MTANLVYHVKFPKLGISFNVNPIAFSLGTISIKWYGIIIATGFLAGFIYVISKSKFWGLSKEKLYDMVFISSITAIMFARIYYVLFFPGEYYKLHPEKIFAISEGGIAIYGAIIGGIIGLIIMCKILRQKLLTVLDLFSIGLSIGQCIGRWGNFANQEAFGSKTNAWWGMLSEGTGNVAVHPCFFYESLGCFVIFLILHFSSKKLKNVPGMTFTLYTCLYGILRAAIEGLRTDSLIIPGTNLKVSLVLAVLLFLVSCIVFFIKIIKDNKLYRHND